MKKLFANAGLLASFVLMLGIVGHAQVSQRYRAQIPFDFQINDVVYTAGDYSVGRLSSGSNTGALSIIDRGTGKTHIIGQSALGSETAAMDGKLVFDHTSSGYSLREVVTPSFQLKMKPVKIGVQITENGVGGTETVAILLTR